MTINYKSPSTFTTAVLITDTIVEKNGSTDVIPGLTEVNGVPVSAALEINSTTGTLLIPRLTQSEIDDLVTTDGMLVYNTDTNTFDFYSNGGVTPSGDVVGPAGVSNGDIAVFSGSTGKIIADSGVNIGLVPPPLFSLHALNFPLDNITEISNVGILAFEGGEGFLFVDTFSILNLYINSPSNKRTAVFTDGVLLTPTSESALVELSSTTGVLLISRLTNAQIGALVDPIDGMIVYNTDDELFNIREAGFWMPVSTGAAGGSVSSVATGVGLTGGPITTTGTISIANTAVAPGSYTYAAITVNAQGQLTSAANGVTPAPTNATYITQSHNSVLTNEQSLGDLVTGLLLNTVSASTGVLSRATPGTDYYSPGFPSTIIDETGTTNNFFIGTSTGGPSLAGGGNQGLGISVLENLTSGDRNVGYGLFSLNSIVNTNDNASYGYDSMSSSIGSRSSSFGSQSLNNVSTAHQNDSAFGYKSLYLYNSGSENCSFGANSAATFDTYTQCVFLGANSDAGNNSLTNAIAIGYGAIVNTSNVMVLGNNVRVGIGHNTAAYTLDLANTQGDCTLFMSSTSATPSIPGTGGVIYVSSGDLFFSGNGQTIDLSTSATGGAPKTATYITQSHNSTLTNEQSLGDLTTGLMKNTVTGSTGVLSTAIAGTDYYSLNNPTRLIDEAGSSGNIFMGQSAGVVGASGTSNLGIGTNVLMSLTTGTLNTVYGNSALVNLVSASSNSSFGASSLNACVSSNNSAFGKGALNNLSSANGSNVAIGASTGNSFTDYNQCVLLGSTADTFSSGLQNAIAIGYGAIVNSSNSMVLGNNVQVAIGLNNPAYTLHLANVNTKCALAFANTASSPTGPASGGIVYVDTNLLFFKNSTMTIDLTNGGAGAAPVGAQYLINTANATLTNAQNLGLLDPGILKISVTDGVATVEHAVPDVDYATEATLVALVTEASGYATDAFNSSLAAAASATIASSAESAIIGATGSHFIIQTSNVDLPNSQVLASLATGIVKNTTGTGVLSIASAGSDYYSAGHPTTLIDTGSNLFGGTNNGPSSPSGTLNTGWGDGSSLSSLSSGSRNSSLGNASLTAVAITSDNSGFGYKSLFVNAGFSNTAMGSFSSPASTISSLDSSFGYQSLLLYSGNGGSNTSIGANSGSARANYTHCTFLGTLADASATGLTNATAIGYNAQVGVSNALILGNNVNVGIGTSSPAGQNALHIANVGPGPSFATLFMENTTNIPTIPASGTILYSTGSHLVVRGNSTTIDISALSTSKYIIQIADANLPNAQSLGVLTTGLVKNTVTGSTGVLSTAVAGTDYYSAGKPTTIIDEHLTNNNFYIGTNAGGAGLAGSFNTGVGIGVLQAITSASFSTAFGYQALNSITTQNSGTAFGYQSLKLSTGLRCTAVGTDTASSSTTANDDTILGYHGLFLYTNNGGNNTIIGSQAGTSQVAYTQCTLLGSSADCSANNLTNAIAIGYNSSVAASNSMVLGNNVNVIIGGNNPSYTLHLANVASSCVLFLTNTTTVPSIPASGSALYSTGNNLTFRGNSTTVNISGLATSKYILQQADSNLPNAQSLGVLSTGLMKNTVSGSTGVVSTASAGTDYYAPGFPTTIIDESGSTNNFFIGTSTGGVSLAGSGNYGSGISVLSSLTSGQNNSAAGYRALNALVNQDVNTAFGNQCLAACTGTQNVGLGASALRNTVNTTNNVGLGYSALTALTTTGNGNTAVGANSGSSQVQYTNCLFLGSGSDASANALTNAIAIGHNSTVSTSNSMVLGNNVNVGIGTSSPVNPLHVVGNIQQKGITSGWTGTDVIKGQASVQTSGTTITTILSVPVPTATDTAVTIVFTITAIRSTGASAASSDRATTVGAWYNGTTTAIIGTPTAINFNNSAAFAVAATTAVSGNNLNIRVTGIVAETINWVINYEYYSVTTSTA